MLFVKFLSVLAKIVHFILVVYMWIIIIRAILSWVNVPSLYPLAVILHRLTEPVLRPFRRIIPSYKLGGIDITPIIVILIIGLVDLFLVNTLDDYAQTLLQKYRLDSY